MVALLLVSFSGVAAGLKGNAVVPVKLDSAAKGYKAILKAISDDPAERRSAADELIAMRDPSLVPAIIDALFFASKNSRNELVSVLEGLTGENLGNGYYEWVEWIGRHSEFKPGPGYQAWKASLLSRIDPRYNDLLRPAMGLRIRLEEIVWGGVKFDGIPSLERPDRISAAEATYLEPDEKVFGLSINDENHAYPLRILSWHEMTNDVVGGEPVTLSF